MGKMSKDKIAIPVEIKYRELSARLFLAVVLADRGYDVYLGNKIQHTALDKIDPDVYFETGARQQKSRLQRCQQNGISTLILETEGQAWGGSDEFTVALDKETLEHTDCYCAWGSAAMDAVAKTSPETRTEVTGNPRFDLLQEPHRKIYAERSNQLKEKYDEYILFNTNFSGANGEKSLKEIDEQHFNKNHPVMERIRAQIGTQTKIFGKFITLIAETAERFSGYNVVVRPHPSESQDLYENCFYGYENVHIDKRFEVRPWIIASEVAIHNSCTTGITAALLNTPVISYVPNGWESSETPNNISERCTEIAEVFEKIRYYTDDNKQFTLCADSKSELQTHIHNIDYLSAERIADVVDSITAGKNKKSSLETNNKLAFRRALVRTLGSRRFEELWVKRLRGESRHKFEYVTTAEVQSIIDRFTDEIKPEGLTIDRLKYMVNGFRVRACE
jgi:surface carbohydrate biosynthesis protein